MPKVFPLSSVTILDFGFGDQPKQIFLKALRHNFCRQIAALHGANQRADVVDRMGIAAEQRGDADIAAHLDDIGDEPFLAEKAALLGDV